MKKIVVIILILLIVIIGIFFSNKGGSAQVILRWHIQNDYVAIPGSADEDEIAENIDIFDFELTDEDLEKMQQLDTGTRFFTMSESEQESAFTNFAPDFNNQK